MRCSREVLPVAATKVLSLAAALEFIYLFLKKSLLPMQAGELESANSRARILDRLESTRDGAPHVSPSHDKFTLCDKDSSWGGQTSRQSVRAEQQAAGRSPAEPGISLDGSIDQRGRVKERTDETRGGSERTEQENSGRGETPVAPEDGELDWLDPQRWGYGAPPRVDILRPPGAQNGTGVGASWDFAAGGGIRLGNDPRIGGEEMARNRERPGESRAAERLVGSVQRSVELGELATQRFSGLQPSGRGVRCEGLKIRGRRQVGIWGGRVNGGKARGKRRQIVWGGRIRGVKARGLWRQIVRCG